MVRTRRWRHDHARRAASGLRLRVVCGEGVRSVMEVDRRWVAAGVGQVGVGTERGLLRRTTAIRLLCVDCSGC